MKAVHIHRKETPYTSGVMLLNAAEGTWWPGFMEITMDGSVSFRTVTALGVTELFECTGTGFRVYGYIDFFNG